MIGIAVIVCFGHSGRSDEWKGIALGLASGVAYAVVVIGMRGSADSIRSGSARSITWRARRRLGCG